MLITYEKELLRPLTCIRFAYFYTDTVGFGDFHSCCIERFMFEFVRYIYKFIHDVLFAIHINTRTIQHTIEHTSYVLYFPCKLSLPILFMSSCRTTTIFPFVVRVFLYLSHLYTLFLMVGLMIKTYKFRLAKVRN